MAQAKRKKRFFDVEIPLINKQTQLQAYELKELNNRFLNYDLTRILRGKSIILQLKVKIENEKAIAYPRKIKLMPYFLRRAVRKGTNYIEDSFSTKCQNAELKIKPFLISRRKISRAVRKALREKAREELINYVKDKNSIELFEEILKNQIQRSLSAKLKKIYPLALCEIRVLKIEKLIKDKSKSKSMKEEDKIENAADEMTKDIKIENVKKPAEKKEVKKEIEKEVEEAIEDVVEEDKE